MATCKDCVHYAVCGYRTHENEICNHFKNKADCVEVVRCDNCKNLKIINDGKVYAQCTETGFEFLPFGTDTRKHFCGYGERKCNNG